MRLIPSSVRLAVTATLVAGVVGLAACGTNSSGDGKVKVVAAFYPLAEAVRQVGGSFVSVENLTRVGAEPHDLELTPSQVADIQDADLVVEMGRAFQPGVERAAKASKRRLIVLDELQPSRLRQADPHAWLDLGSMDRIVGFVAASLASADPAHASQYERAATAYRARLVALDQRYAAGLARCDRTEIVTAHEAFGWLADRYHLTQVAITGLNPEAEPTPQKLAELADLVRRDHVTTIFPETLLSPRAADALAREANVQTDVLNPIEGLTQPQVTAGENYVSLMEANLLKLRRALGCR